MLLSEDQPIEKHEQDRLGRTRFAQALARAVLARRGRDSFVMALHGEWGSGKTSIKNLVLEQLRFDASTCPSIVEFEPWLWTDVPSLTQAFFGAIEGALLTDEQAEEREGSERRTLVKKKSAERLSIYKLFFTTGSWVLKGGSLLAAAHGDAQGALGLALASSQADEAGKIAGEGAATLKEDVDEGKEADKSASLINLTKVRQELANSLGELDRPILVVIDDIDRLTAEEISALFALVKANVNFPNLVYLLLFQRDLVEKSLEKITTGTGRDFLEKIVQAGFDVPEPEATALERMLQDALNEVLSPIEGKFNETRLQILWVLALPRFFQSARDVRRFINALSFQLDVMVSSDNEGLEVDIVDLLGLEALRVFEPQLYQRLYPNKALLTKQRSTGTPDKKYEAGVEVLVQSLMAEVAADRKSDIEGLLQELFPQIQWAFGQRNYYNSIPWTDALRQARVCHPTTFDRYFQLSVNARDISNAEVRALVNATSDRDKFVAQLLNFYRRGLLDVALERLRVYAGDISRESVVPVLTGLLDVGDIFPSVPLSREFSFGWGQEMVARSLLGDYFSRGWEQWKIESEGEPWPRPERVAAFREAFAETTGCFLPTYLTYYETRNLKGAKEPQDDSHYLLDEADTLSLRPLCVDHIRRAAAEGRLIKQPRATFIISCWREWSEPQEVQEWLDRTSSTPSGFLSLIRMTMSQSLTQNLGSRFSISRRETNISLGDLHWLIPLDDVASRINGLNLSSLNDEDKQTIEAFRFSLRQIRRGDMRFRLPEGVQLAPDSDTFMISFSDATQGTGNISDTSDGDYDRDEPDPEGGE